jgi:CRP-like cAMP-binding protein
VTTDVLNGLLMVGVHRCMRWQQCRRIGRLYAGQHFGEVACWTGARRTASVVTITTCELYCLSRPSLLQLVEEWPEVTHEINIMGTILPFLQLFRQYLLFLRHMCTLRMRGLLYISKRPSIFKERPKGRSLEVESGFNILGLLVE